MAALTGPLAGCGASGFYERTAALLEAHCAESTACTVDLVEAAPFAWQKMYFFGVGVRQETVSQVIGTAYPDYDTVTERIIFIDNGKIVRNEDHLVDYDSKQTKTLVFEAVASESFFMVERAKSLVDVRVERLGGHVFYHLTPRR